MIVRNILGHEIEIELTEKEEMEIYDSVQHRYDTEVFREYLDAEGYYNVNEDVIKAMAKEMRNVAYDMDLDDGMDLAREKVLDQHRGMLEYFKEEE